MISVETSYSHQAASEGQMRLPTRYTAPDTVDNWRHTRMLMSVAPIIKVRPDATWLTVGDGRYGSDAAFLKEQGVKVTATSLTGERLKIAHEMGRIDEWRVENAEKISLPDSSVDFVLCKEAYHHFPRPPIALYEMLRVARTAVVLIEPLDNPKILDVVRSVAKRLLRGDRELQFEPSGNFLFRLDTRELAKLMCAQGGQMLAVKGINDFYHRRFSSARSDAFNAGFVATRVGIAVQDVFARLGLMRYSLGTVVVFKDSPDSRLPPALLGSGFRLVKLPKNPYV